MAKTYYLPNSDKERAIWLKNFSSKFTGYAVDLGFTTADSTSVANDNAVYSYLLEQIEIFKTELNERQRYKDTLRNGPLGTALGGLPTLPDLPTPPTAVAAGVFPRVSAMVKRIKAHPAYSEAIGQDLGIIGAEYSLDLIAMQPTLTLSKEPGTVILKYVRSGVNGIKLYCKRGAEQEYKFLSTVTLTSYRDRRPNLVPGQPEMRTYKAQFMQDDEEVGQESAEFSIML
jgi:hypothetical protein